MFDAFLFGRYAGFLSSSFERALGGALHVAFDSRLRAENTSFVANYATYHGLGHEIAALGSTNRTVVALRGCDRASPPRARSALADPAALFDSRSTQQNTTSHMQNSHRHTVNEQIALLETDEQITLLESKVRSLLTRVRTPQSAPLRTPVRSPLTARVRACDAESSFARAEPAVRAIRQVVGRHARVREWRAASHGPASERSWGLFHRCGELGRVWRLG